MKCDQCARPATEGGVSFSDTLHRQVTYAACEHHAKDVRLKFHAHITVLTEQTELAL